MKINADESGIFYSRCLRNILVSTDMLSKVYKSFFQVKNFLLDFFQVKITKTYLLLISCYNSDILISLVWNHLKKENQHFIWVSLYREICL